MKLLHFSLFSLIGTNLVSSESPVWSEEFEGSSLDSNTWSYDTGRTGWGNGELQNYTASADNVYVQDGLLHIAVQQLEDNTFTSGRINTLQKFSFKYGSLVANISWPVVVEGLWPAFWTLGASFPGTPWPACGEVDILEAGQGKGLSVGQGNRRVVPAAHWEDETMDNPSNPLKLASHKMEYDHPTDLAGSFHLYKLDWTPEYLEVFLDDMSIFKIDISETACPTCSEFRAPHSLLTNLAVGGGFTSYSNSPGMGESSPGMGTNSPGCGEDSPGVNSPGENCGTGLRTEADITAPIPAVMMIDYIRLYANSDTELFLPKTESPVSTPTLAPTRQPIAATPLPTPLPTEANNQVNSAQTSEPTSAPKTVSATTQSPVTPQRSTDRPSFQPTRSPSRPLIAPTTASGDVDQSSPTSPSGKVGKTGKVGGKTGKAGGKSGGKTGKVGGKGKKGGGKKGAITTSTSSLGLGSGADAKAASTAAGFVAAAAGLVLL